MTSKWCNPQKYTWGIDVSEYRPVVDWKSLHDAGASWVSAKMTDGAYYEDPLWSTHCQNAYNWDLPLDGYHFFDPSFYIPFPMDDFSRWPSPETDLQFQNVVRAMRNKAIASFTLDVERWWTDYNQWLAYRRGEITEDKVGKISPTWINTATSFFLDRVHKVYPDLPIFVYTSTGFITSYTRTGSGKSLASLDNILAAKPWVNPWVAYWPYSSTVVNCNTWQDYWDRYTPPDQLTFNNGTHDGPPWIGNRLPSRWQCSGDKFLFPQVTDTYGNAKTVDLNIAWGSRDQLYQQLHYTPHGVITPVPVPTPTPTPVPAGFTQMTLLKNGVNVRLSPTTQSKSVGIVNAGDVLNLTGQAAEGEGYHWEEVKLWVSRGTDTNPFGALK